MWLLNHTTARRFEVDMLKRIGFRENFLPKSFPQDIHFRSASIDFSEDATLSIPASDLAVLNETNWYSEPSRDAWDTANRHFDLLFFMMWPPLLRSLSDHFRGAAIMRAYGLSKDTSYSALISEAAGGLRTAENMGRRFWLGTAYDRLAELESPWLQKREVYLPLGLQDCRVSDCWTGKDAKIYFVCPDIEGNSYYTGIYREFKKQFAGFPYAVGGDQGLATTDPHVLGFVPEEQHQENMRKFRVMFYPSREPNQIHYHPFEAIRAGMPLVFMSGGMLDRRGDCALPGCCRDYDQARDKIRRILAGDRKLSEDIRASQPILLEKLCPKALEPPWKTGLDCVLTELDSLRKHQPPFRRHRVAIIVPVPYRGGTLRSAKLLAEAVSTGSRESGEEVEVVLAYNSQVGDTPGETVGDKWEAGLPSFIAPRTIRWERLGAQSALRAMKYAGHTNWTPAEPAYMVPDDRTHNLLDCDLWMVVSDRLEAPLLPIRPYVMIVFDYVQRYNSQFPSGADTSFLAAARSAKKVLVTTRFTELDAIAYAGLSGEKVIRVPMLVPHVESWKQVPVAAPDSYFLWTTNLASHKNHCNALCALDEYYRLLDGKFDCCVTGVETDRLLNGGSPHLDSLRHFVASRPELTGKLRILGELPDNLYQMKLSAASFLWHPASIDNGTLAVVEAAALGVPALSSRYPAMEEMNEQFKLHLTWMESSQPSDMANRLKWMEEHACQIRAELPTAEELAAQTVMRNAAAYWSVIRECL